MRRLALVAVVGALAFVPLVDAPARAQAAPCDATEGDSSKIAGAVDSPASGAEPYRDDEQVTVSLSGIRYRDQGVFDQGDITRIELQVLGCDGQFVSNDAARLVSPSGADPDGGRAVQWDTPPLSWNGAYALRVTITATTSEGETARRTIVRPFVMDMPASPPKNVKASSADGKTVVVTWDANPEPDIQGYIVEWASENDPGFENSTTANVTGSAAGDPPPTRFQHDQAEGVWRYRLRAVRPGTERQGLNTSPPTRATTATVTRPTTTTGAAPGNRTDGTTSVPASDRGTGSSTTARAPGTTARASGGSGVDLSSFSRLLEQRRRSSSTTAPRAAAPDTGFEETLPFEPREDEPAVAASVEPVEPSGSHELAQEQELGLDDSERRRALSFVAGGLLAFVLALGMRMLRREAETLDLDATAPREPSAAPEADADPSVPDEESEAPAPSFVEPSFVEPSFVEPSFVEPSILELGGDEGAQPEPAATSMPMPRPVQVATAPNLDVPLPARRPRRARADGVGTGDAGRAAPRVPSGPAVDRGQGAAPVRPRRRRARSSDRRTPVG